MHVPPANAVVCLDGRNLALRHGTGVTTYATSLANGLRQTGRNAGVLLDADPADPDRPGRAQRWLHAVWPGATRAAVLTRSPPGFVQAWLAHDAFRRAQVNFDIHGRLLRIASQHPPALMHWTYPLPLAFQGTVNVYTVHDLIPLRAPALTDIDSARFARIIAAVVRSASHLITVSEASKHDIMTLLGVPEDRVTNTYQPIDLPSGLRLSPPPSRQGHLLFCGAIEPRKNLRRLIAAYQQSGARAPLILAGPDGWQAAREVAGVEIRPLDPQAQATTGVWRAPFLARPALLDLIRGARAMLFPSLAEGFGLPIAEAMSLGIPVLTSQGGVTEEIAGGAALLIDPHDIRAIAQGIAALDRDTALCGRLATAGLRRSAMFTPAACFDRLAALYDKLGVARA